MIKPDLVLPTDLMPDEALRQAGWVLKDIGKLTVFEKEQLIAKGEVFWLNRIVLVDVKVVKKASGRADLHIEAVSLSLMTHESDSAVKRFVDAFNSYGQPGYKPDRVGVSHSTIVRFILLAIAVNVTFHILNAIFRLV